MQHNFNFETDLESVDHYTQQNWAFGGERYD